MNNKLFFGTITEWNATELHNVAKIIKGQQLNASRLSNHGDYYVLNGGIVPSGYYSEFNTEANTISISEGGNSCGYVNLNKEKFWSGGHNYTLNDVKISTNYLYSYLKSIETFIMSKRVGSGLPNIQKTSLQEIIIRYPQSKERQETIGDFFILFDDLIEAIQAELYSLNKLQTACIQTLLPDIAEQTPKVRFDGCVSEWEKVRLAEILSERHEISTITSLLPQLSFTIAEGVIRPEDRKSNQRDFLIKDKDNKRYLITRVGDIIYNPANVVYGAIHQNSLIDGVVSPIYRIFTTKQDSNFIECIVRRPSFINKLAMRTEGTVTKLKTLKPEAFLDMTVCIPSDIGEQQKIGAYFKNISDLISLQSQRLEKIKQIKSACLDIMFV